MDARTDAAAASALVEGLGDGAAAGFALLDADLNVVLASPSLAGWIAPAQEPLAAALERARSDRSATAGLALRSPDGERWRADVRPADDGGSPIVAVAAARSTLRASDELLDAAQGMARLGWWSWRADRGVVTMSPQLTAMIGREADGSNELSAELWLDSVVPEEREEAVEAVERALNDGTRLDIRLRVRGGDGRQRVLHARAEPLLGGDGMTVGLQGFSQDVTEEESATRQQRAVAQLGRAALAGEPVDQLLQRAATLVGETLFVDMSAVFELEPDGETLAMRAAWSAVPYDGPRQVKSGVNSQAGYCVATRGPVVVADWEREDRFHRSETIEAIGARSGACVPIRGGERPFGVLGAQSRTPDRFQDDVVFLQAVADVLADAIDRARAAEEIAELAQARGRLVGQALEGEERARATIAERLHDGALQELLAAGHDLYGLDPDGTRPEVAAAQQRLRAVVGSLREAMGALHPTVLRHGGLAAALEAVAEQRGNVHVDVDPAAAGRRDELVLSLARELLAGARDRSVRVAVSPAAGGVRLDVAGAADDVRGVAERVAAVGGRVEQADGGVAVLLPDVP